MALGVLNTMPPFDILVFSDMLLLRDFCLAMVLIFISLWCVFRGIMLPLGILVWVIHIRLCFGPITLVNRRNKKGGPACA